MEIPVFSTFRAKAAPPPRATLKTMYYLLFIGGFGWASRRQGGIFAKGANFRKNALEFQKIMKIMEFCTFRDFLLLGVRGAPEGLPKRYHSKGFAHPGAEGPHFERKV